MPRQISCPGCNEAGLVGSRLRGFEPRGTYAETDHPVYRCINCGCGIAVRPRRIGRRGARIELIEADVWGRMEYKWGRENPLPATEVPAIPSVEVLVEQLRATWGGSDHMVHVIAEAAEVSEAEVRRMLGAA